MIKLGLFNDRQSVLKYRLEKLYGDFFKGLCGIKYHQGSHWVVRSVDPNAVIRSTTRYTKITTKELN